MSDLSNYPNIVSLLETPSRSRAPTRYGIPKAPSASASSITVDESKYATPIRANQPPVWEIGDEKSEHGSVRSVDSRIVYNDEQRTLRDLLINNYSYQELRAIAKQAKIITHHRGQTAENISSRLAHNQSNPVVRDAIRNALHIAEAEVVDDTPVKAMKTRAKTRAAEIPVSVSRKKGQLQQLNQMSKGALF